MSSLFAVPAGRLAKWLVALAWLVVVVAVIGANLPGKFADAEKNESTSFLPGDAESTKALQVTERLQGGEKAATVIVYRRDGGLTATDRRAITNDVAQLNRITRRFDNSTPFGNPTDPRAARRTSSRRTARRRSSPTSSPAPARATTSSTRSTPTARRSARTAATACR